MGDIHSENVSEFRKKQIFNLRFPFKLWILVSVPNPVLNWSREGCAIQFNYIELNRYLSSRASIFKCRTALQFLRQLTIHEFERVTSDDLTARDTRLEFRHANFVADRFDLVQLIQPLEFPPIGYRQPMIGAVKNSYSGSDPCLQKVSAVPAIERARLRLRVLIQVYHETYMLDRKLSECDPKKPSGQTAVIELPADAFENAADSVSNFEENPEYAGYYGSASPEQLKEFFGEYLPVYAQENGEGDKGAQASNADRAIDTSSCLPQHQQLPLDDLPSIIPNFKIEYPLDLTTTTNENKSCNFEIVAEASGSIIASSVVGVDQTVHEANEFGKTADCSMHDEDICMNDFLKFKDPLQECVDEKDVGGTPKATVCDATIEIKEEDLIERMDFTEKHETEMTTDASGHDAEATYDSFANQFRDSINLLCE